MKKFKDLSQGDTIWIVDFNYENSKWFSYDGNIIISERIVEHDLYRLESYENLRLYIKAYTNPLYINDKLSYHIKILKHEYEFGYNSAIYCSHYNLEIGPPKLFFSDKDIMKEVIAAFIKDIDIIYREKFRDLKKNRILSLKTLKSKLNSL